MTAIPKPASCPQTVISDERAPARHDAGANSRRSAASKKAWRSRRKMLAAIREAYSRP